MPKRLSLPYEDPADYNRTVMSMLRFASLLILVALGRRTGGARRRRRRRRCSTALGRARSGRRRRHGAARSSARFSARFHRVSWMLGAGLHPAPRRPRRARPATCDGSESGCGRRQHAGDEPDGRAVCSRRESRRFGSDAGGRSRICRKATRRIEFGRLHGASTALMVITLVAGAGLIWVEMRDAAMDARSRAATLDRRT